MLTAKEIRQTRVEARMTQRKAASLVRVHPNIWKQWEDGIKRMPEATLDYFRIVTSSY